MKTCATRTYLATPAEHLLMLLLIELMLYVRPCAMEMPALLAALLQDAGTQHHLAYEDFSDALISPPAAAAIPADVTQAEAASPNELSERKEMFGEALDEHAAENINNFDEFDGFLPPVIATAGIPPKGTKQHKISPSTSSSSSSSSGSKPPSVAPLRHCSIEIITKVPGICQNLPHAVGSACVAGDYMDVFNVECMGMNRF